MTLMTQNDTNDTKVKLMTLMTQMTPDDTNETKVMQK